MISLYDVLEASNGQLFGEPAAQLFADFSLDSRQPQESHLYVALKNERGDGHQTMEEAVQQGATGILCTNPPTFDTRGVSVILVKDPQTALMNWARYIVARLGTRIVAIAGVSDQSVTTEASGLVLGSRYKVHYRGQDLRGQLALPLALARVSVEHELALLNVRLTQPGDMAEMLKLVSPFAAIIPGIPAVPPSGFENREQIAGEYQLLLGQLPEDGLAIISNDDDLSRGLAMSTRARRLTVGIEEFGADLLAYNIVYGSGGTGFDLRHGPSRLVGRWVPLLGKDQFSSVLYALGLGAFLGVPVEEGVRILKDMSHLPGRMRPFIGLNGSLLIDASGAADSHSALSALDWLAEVRVEHRRAVVVLGNLEKQNAPRQRSQRALGQRAARVADVLLTLGPEAAIAGRAALDEGMPAKQVAIVYNTPDAVARLKQEYVPGAEDLVLVLGGAGARMDRVVEAMLNDAADAAFLLRGDSASEIHAAPERVRPSWVDVDLGALAQNVRALKRLVGEDVTLTAVVKADAYGAGAVAVARTALLNGAAHLAVANMAEALELREAGIAAPILIMGYTPASLIREAVRHHLAVTVYDSDLARAYDRAAREAGGKLGIHVKIDTGMGRLGLLPDKAVIFFRQLLGLHALQVEGVFTHFSVADEDQEFTNQQVARFKSVIQPLRASGFNIKHIHAANSAGTLASPDYHFSMVRVGLAMHGVAPSESLPLPADFRPVLSWKTVVAQVKTLPKGHAVGYGNTYITEAEERVAVLPVGYADGFRRGPENWGYVLIHGQFAPIVGRVSMEKTTVNVTHIPQVAVDDEVVLLGAQGENRITAEDIARQIGTISYEVLCSVLPRAPRG